MSQRIVRVLREAVNLSGQLIRNIGPTLSLGLRTFNDALRDSSTGLGRLAGGFRNVLNGLTPVIRALRNIGNIDLTAPFTELFPIIGRSRAAFELLKGTILSIKTATLDAAQAIEDGTRRATTSIVSQVQLVDKATGEVIDDVAEKISQIDPKLRQLQENLIKRAPELVGVTTRDILDVFEQVSLNFGNLTQQLSAARAEELGLGSLIDADGVVNDFAVAEKLTERLASSLKNAGLTARDTAQEVRAILTGDIDFNARLAKRIKLTRAEFEIARARGDLAGLLFEKTAEIEDANENYNKSLTNTFSVIQDVVEGFGRIIGRNVFESLQESLLTFRQRLEENRDIIDSLADRLGGTFSATIANVVDSINQIFDFILENEKDVSNFLELVVVSLGDIVRFTANATKTLLQFGTFLVSLRDDIERLGDTLGKLNPNNWFPERDVDKASNNITRLTKDLSFDEPIEGIKNLNKEIGQTGALQDFFNLTGRLIRNLPLLGKSGRELTEALQDNFSGLLTNVDEQISNSAEKSQELALAIEKALSVGDQAEVDRLTKLLVDLNNLNSSGVEETFDSLRQTRNELNAVFAELTPEQEKQLESLQNQLVELKLIEASVFAQIPAYQEIKDENGEIVTDLIKTNLQLLETTKNEEERKQLIQEIVKDYDLVRLAVEGTGKDLQAQLKLQKNLGDTIELAGQKAETSILNLSQAGQTSQEVFNNLKTALEDIAFAQDVGASIENISKFFAELQDNLERLAPEQRKQAIAQILKIEENIFKQKAEEAKVTAKIVDLEEARGLISAAEADRKRALQKEQAALLSLIKTEQQIALQRNVLGSETLDLERKLIAQLTTAEGVERDKLMTKLEQLRAQDGITGAQLETLKATRDQQQAELLIQEAKNSTLGIETAIAEAIREQNLLKEQQELSAAQFGVDLELSGLSEARKELENFRFELKNLNEQQDLLAQKRLLIEEEIRKANEANAEVSEQKLDELNSKRIGFLKEQLQLESQIITLTSNANAQEIKVRQEALNKEADNSQFILDLTKEAISVQQNLNAELQKNAELLANLELKPLEFKLDNLDRAKSLIDRLESDKIQPFASEEASKALRTIRKEFGDLLSDGQKGEKALFDAIQDRQRLNRELNEQRNRADLAKIDAQIKIAESERAITGIAQQNLILENEILIAKLKTLDATNKRKLSEQEITQELFEQRSLSLGNQITELEDRNKALRDSIDSLKDSKDAQIEALRASRDLTEEYQDTTRRVNNLTDSLETLSNSFENSADAAASSASRIARSFSQNFSGNDPFKLKEGLEPIERLGEGAIDSFLDSRLGPTFSSNFLNQLTDAERNAYTEAYSSLGSDAAKVFNDAFSKSIEKTSKSAQFAGNFEFKFGVDLEAFSKRQEEATQRGVEAVLEASRKDIEASERAEEQRQAQEQLQEEAIRQQERLADEAQRREDAQQDLLKELIDEARQARLAELDQQKDLLQAQIDTKKEIEQSLSSLASDNTSDIFSLAASVTRRLEEDGGIQSQQAFAALVEVFGQETANALRGVIDIDEQILEQLQEGTVNASDLTSGNKIFLDPNTGQLIVTGKDPDFEKLTQLIELQALNETEERALGVLRDIESNTSRTDAFQTIQDAVDRGIVGTGEQNKGVLFNDQGQAVGVVDTTLDPEIIADVLRDLEQTNRATTDLLASGQIAEDPRIAQFNEEFDNNLQLLLRNTDQLAEFTEGARAEEQIGRVESQIEEINSNEIRNSNLEIAENTGLSITAIENLRQSINDGFQNFDSRFENFVTNAETGNATTTTNLSQSSINDLGSAISTSTTATPTAATSVGTLSTGSLTPTGLRSLNLGSGVSTISTTSNAGTNQAATSVSSPSQSSLIATDSSPGGGGGFTSEQRSIINNYIQNNYPSNVGSERLLSTRSGI